MRSQKMIAAIMAVNMTAGFFSLCAGALQAETTAEPLQFNNGKFKIMHITDTHLDSDNVKDSTKLIELACDYEKPDLVMVTGDNVTAVENKSDTEALIDSLMNIFESRKIPVAVTFGNHDSETGFYGREELMAYYNTFDCSISIDDGPELTGCGTYNIPLLSSDGESTVFNIWVFDSGDYDDEHHYANVAEDQVNWYKEKSIELKRAAGKKVPSLVFQHIIVPEVYDALEEVRFKGAYTYAHMYDKTRFFRFKEGNVNFGQLHETPCCGYYNHGQFNALVERGDVLAMFFGHDHTNAFGVRNQGIDIVNSLSTRFNGDAFSTQYGYRIIEIDENDTAKYTSRVVHWYDMVNIKEIKSIGKAAGASNLLSKIRLLGFLTKTSKIVGTGIVELFTGRTVKYPD